MYEWKDMCNCGAAIIMDCWL